MKKRFYLAITLVALLPSATKSAQPAATTTNEALRIIVREELARFTANLQKELEATLQKIETEKEEKTTFQEASKLVKEKESLETLIKSKIPTIGKTIAYNHLIKRLNEARTKKELTKIRENLTELEQLVLGL